MFMIKAIAILIALALPLLAADNEQYWTGRNWASLPAIAKVAYIRGVMEGETASDVSIAVNTKVSISKAREMTESQDHALHIYFWRNHQGHRFVLH
jgi:hypothetical protein